ncbi:hypothetical protein SAMN05216251_1122 [Actinacidiphila alni]|uniref:Uncharacterized protein n=1 Tax=Actinacidiphila alni TaxID=380248 RepID=A0A1I2HZQ9_9ACTN|nr:hypothetical protein [Actinacidiphila alni]SFF34257.1 hypothetical protein SAMN05216251_1122 [Actinacidiphila alni]
MMRFRVQAGADAPTTVVFEPWGEEHVLAPGDHLEIVFPSGVDDDEITMGVEYAAGSVILHQEVIATVRVWDSAGREINLV